MILYHEQIRANQLHSIMEYLGLVFGVAAVHAAIAKDVGARIGGRGRPRFVYLGGRLEGGDRPPWALISAFQADQFPAPCW